MTRITIQDKNTFRVTHREFTDEGFLKVPGRVAKTGIQQYLRKELMLDGDPNEVVNVFRPEDEVFKAESLDTYNCADITVLHPKDLVTPVTYKNHTVGVIKGPGTQDGDFVLANLVIKDADAIKAINDGMAELSAGYTADYVAQDGTAPSGENYQYIQRDIRVNHVAIVPMARAGRQARIFDNQQRETAMTKVTLDSGRSVDVQDEATALLVTDAFDRLNKEVTDANKAVSDAQAEIQKKQAVIDAQKEEIDALKLKSSDEEIKLRVEHIAKVKDAAKTVAGDAFTTDSMNDVEVMREALQVARPATAWADKEALYVQTAFDMALESAKASPEQKNKEQLARLAQDGAQGMQQQTSDAHSEYKDRLTKPQAQEA